MPLYKRPDELDEEDIDLNTNDTPVNDENLTPEEKTWSKRYGDLRRLLAQKEKQWQEKFDQQAVRLQNSTALSVPDANDEAAIEQWIAEHPQIARIVTGIADRRAQAATEQFTTRMQELDAREKQSEQQIAYRKVDEAHPDFFDVIRHEEKFHSWLAGKSQRLQDAIYGDENDWKTAIDVIALYKVENGKTNKKTSTPREAAEYVPSKQSATPKTGGRTTWKESDIARMTGAEYEKYEDQINEAMRNGEVLMDISGGAR